ncbi:MAG: ribosome maturation factor RimP [Limnothrix sp.]
MAHPLVPEIVNCAEPIATNLGLEIVDVVFQTNKKPPVLRIDIRNLTQDTGLEDCEQFSRQFDAYLEETALIPGAYVMEVSSPGTERALALDREFVAFRGFPILVKTYAPYKDKKEWQGTLQKRDDEAIYLSQKGKSIVIPRELVARVQLAEQRQN